METKIFIFNAEKNKTIYAATNDESGKNLPEGKIKTKWKFVKEIDCGKTPIVGIDCQAAQKEISDNGYHLFSVTMVSSF